MNNEKVIYSKFSDYRKVEYRIITKIWIDNYNNKFVTKEAKTKDAQKHINNIYNNKMLLKSINPSYSVNDCVYYGEKLKFEYLEGKSLLDEIIDSLKSGNQSKFHDLLDVYFNLLIGNEDNIIEFYYTDKFKDIYGEIEGLEGFRALKISNVDAIPENILNIDGLYTVFDYEWVYDFPIPLDFIVYRNFFDLFFRKLSNVYLNENFKSILSKYIQHYNWDILNLQMNNFSDSIVIDTTMNIDFSKINFNYIKNKYNVKEALLKKEQEAELNIINDYRRYIQVFFDYGSGFCENNSYIIKNLDLETNSIVKFEIDIPSTIKNVRIDPSNQSCLVRIKKLKSVNSSDEVEQYYSNGKLTLDNELLFPTDDPIIVYSNVNTTAVKLEVEFEIEYISAAVIQNVINKYDTIEENKRIIAEQVKEIQNIVDVIAMKDKQYLAIINSLSWKITKPLRDLKRFFVSN